MKEDVSTQETAKGVKPKICIFPYYNWLVVEPTHLKNMSQIGSSPQVRVKIKNV